MSDHTCLHEADIARLANSMERIEQQMFGNGQEGLIKTVPALSADIKSLKDTNEDLRIGVSALLKFQAEQTGAEKQRLTTRQKVKIIITTIIGIASIVISLIFNLL